MARVSLPPAVVLAGGLGTRLGALTAQLPKPMVDIAGKPFLCYLLDYLARQGIKEVILAVGYQAEKIIAYFGKQYKSLSLSYSHETQPLGTGGAILQALTLFKLNQAFIINGDSLFLADLKKLWEFHLDKQTELSLALSLQENSARYGKVILDRQQKIIKFTEKGEAGPGLINGGIYLLEFAVFNNFTKGQKFSFEEEALLSLVNQQQVHGLIDSSYFIDIGLPETYAQAQKDFLTLF